MNIWNKVLIGLICFMAIPATLWSAKVLNHYVMRRAEITKMEGDTERALKDIDDARDYDKGIPTLEVRNAALLSDRAENWRFCTPMNVEPLPNKHVRIVFSVKQDLPTTMKVDDTIYVFDQRPFGNGGRYLGRFEVKQVQGADIAAESSNVLTDPESQRLASSFQEIMQIARAGQSVPDASEQSTPGEQAGESQAAWSVFSRCPTDRHDLFVDLSDSEKERCLPKEILALYSQPAENFKAIDFGTLFTHYYKKRVENTVQHAEKLMHQSEIEKSNQMASDALTLCQNENEQLRKEIEQMKAQRDEVEKECQALDAICTRLKSQIQQTQRENERMVEEIRKFQEANQRSSRSAVEPANTISR